MEIWTPQEIMNLRIETVGETPSFCFLWAGSGASLQWGRACLRKWGYRRCEDICWIKSNRESGRNIHYLPDSVVTPTTEHCLMGIKGTVRRNYDGHVIHANVDTDVILSESTDPSFRCSYFGITALDHFERLHLLLRENHFICSGCPRYAVELKLLCGAMVQPLHARGYSHSTPK